MTTLELMMILKVLEDKILKGERIDKEWSKVIHESIVYMYGKHWEGER